MDKAWYFKRGEQQGGPVGWDELKALTIRHDLAPGDKVWTEGFADWIPASSVSDLFTVPAPPARAIPTAPAVVQQAVATVYAQQGAGVIDCSTIVESNLEYASFWARFCAACIDGVIVVAVAIGLTTALVWWVGDETARANAPIVDAFFRVMIIVVSWIYCATLESGPRQSTIGKRVLGLKVTDLDRHQISFGRASARHFGKIVSQLVLMMGYLTMLFTPNSQCLHDMLSGCLVMKKNLN